MKKFFEKGTFKKALPIIAITLVTMLQAIGDQKDSEKIEELENRIKELETKEGA